MLVRRPAERHKPGVKETDYTSISHLLGLGAAQIARHEFLFALLWLFERPDAWTLSLGVRQLDSQEVRRPWLMAGAVKG